MKGQSAAGLSGEFRFVKHNVEGLRGSGPNGEVVFEDLWEMKDGEWVSKCPERVNLDITSKNKILKRGLSYILHRALSGHPGGPYTPSDITVDQTSNPFLAFFVAADDPTFVPSAKYADARVVWNESDGLYDAKVPPTVATAGIGKRAILLTTTTGVGIRRASTDYPTTDPYREIRYTFFAQANTPSYATGTITVDSANLPADGKIFTLNDGYSSLIFEFDSTGSVTAGRVAIDITGSPTDAQLRDRIIEAVNAYADSILITASTGGTAIVSLTHNKGGAIGNKTITNDFTPLGAWAFTGMSGGSAQEVGIANIENLPIKAVGMAKNVNCGDGEGAGVDTKVGVRSVIGLAPTMQGKSDRVYMHEGTSLHKYLTGEKMSDGYGDGYFQSANEETTIRSIIASGSDGIYAGNVVIMKNGAFTQSDVGRSFDISGSGAGNNGRKTISVVYSRIKIQTTESLTAEGNGFTANVVEPSEGFRAYDGDVTSEGITGSMKLGFHWRSATGSGPHQLARIWNTARQVSGVRIILPAGTPKDNCLNTFKIQYLNPLANGSDPRPANDLDWLDVGADVDFTATGQATYIFDGGDKGYEYRFVTPRTTKGIKITSAQAFVSTYAVEIAEFMIFDGLAAFTLTSGVDDALKIATDGIPAVPGVTPGAVGSLRTYNTGTVSTTGLVASYDMQTIADAINKKVRGYEIEALRSDLGYLWIRATVAGGYAQLDFDSTNNGSTANSKLGVSSNPASQVQKVGLTQIVRKYPLDALTMIYVLNISGDLPVS